MKHKKPTNSSLSKHYDDIFTKGEQKHFTSFITSGKPSSEASQIIQQIS